MTKKIGVAITTKDRHDVLYESLKYHIENTIPYVHCLVVIDDNSKEAKTGLAVMSLYDNFRYIYSEKWLGVSGARNAAIEMLECNGCDHFFIMDDDIFPVSPMWTDEYLRAHRSNKGQEWFGASPSPEHSNVCRLGRGNACNKSRMLGGFYSMSEKAVNELGGFEAFGKYGYEDAHYALRAQKAGLSPLGKCPAVIHDDLLFHFCDVSGDYMGFKWPHRSALHEEKGAILVETQQKYLDAIKDIKIFIPYK